MCLPKGVEFFTTQGVVLPTRHVFAHPMTIRLQRGQRLVLLGLRCMGVPFVCSDVKQHRALQMLLLHEFGLLPREGHPSSQLEV